MAGLVDPFERNVSEISNAETSEAGLWQRWRITRDTVAREELIRRFAPYARMLAAVIYKGRFHDEVEFADYHQLACVGLLEAVERFDPDAGVHFKAYAAHRIRGAILNGLEKQTEKNQQIAALQQLQKKRLGALKHDAKYLVGERNMISGADSANFLLSYLAEVGVGLALAVMLEGTSMFVADEVVATVASPEVGYFKKREALQLQEVLRGALESLAQSERQVVYYHYHQGLTFEEIGHLLGVSRGRVSQIHRKALTGLRCALGQGPPCDIFL